MLWLKIWAILTPKLLGVSGNVVIGYHPRSGILKCAPTVESSGSSASVFPPDLDKNGFISDNELGELLTQSGHPQPGYMIREILQKLDRDKDNKISFEEFLSVS